MHSQKKNITKNIINPLYLFAIVIKRGNIPFFARIIYLLLQVFSWKLEINMKNLWTGVLGSNPNLITHPYSCVFFVCVLDNGWTIFDRGLLYSMSRFFTQNVKKAFLKTKWHSCFWGTSMKGNWLLFWKETQIQTVQAAPFTICGRDNRGKLQITKGKIHSFSLL